MGGCQIVYGVNLNCTLVGCVGSGTFNGESGMCMCDRAFVEEHTTTVDGSMRYVCIEQIVTNDRL